MALKDIIFLPTITGKPSEITELYLKKAFLNASKVWFVANNISEHRQYADITWGISGFRRTTAEPNSLKLFCMETEEGYLHPLKADKMSKYVAKRISWLEYFNSKKVLNIVTNNKELCKDIFKNKSDRYSYFLVFVDNEGTTIVFARYQLNYDSAVEFKVNWSFGDPKNEVEQYKLEIARLEESSLQVPSIFNDHDQPNRLIGPYEDLDDYWEEEFQDKENDSIRSLKLYPHQDLAVKNWLESDFKGIFKICTGGGKTIAALQSINRLTNIQVDKNTKPSAVIVTAPTRILADQWIKEIHKFGFRYILKAYESVNNWFNILEPWLSLDAETQPRFVVSTYCTFSDEKFQRKLQHLSEQGIKAVWIADEMHNLASARLLKIMVACSEFFPYRIGLSATPEIENDLDTTEKLFTYFGNILIDYSLDKGINDGVLCPYRYHPIPAYLSPAVGVRYLNYLKEIEDTKPGSPALLNLYRENRELIRTSGVQISAFRDLIPKILSNDHTLSHTLIYSPPGFIRFSEERDVFEDEDENEGERLLSDVITLLRKQNLSCSSIIGETPPAQRIKILQRFESGELNALCAIGCLDEGIDIPAIHTAIVLYSIDRLRQFIQRRGRILRKKPDDEEKIADIYDVIVLPQGSDLPTETVERLLKKELRRYEEFAGMATNHDKAQTILSDALRLSSTTNTMYGESYEQ